MLFVYCLLFVAIATPVLSAGIYPRPALICSRPNEHYECGSACQRRCDRLGQPCPIKNVRCNDACYCDDGYARNLDNECIRIPECPRVKH